MSREDGPPCGFGDSEEDMLQPPRACGPERPEEQLLSWPKCVFSQSVCDREACPRGCHVPTQGLVCGLPVVSEARPGPGSPPLPGKWEEPAPGPEHRAQPSRHQDVTGTAFPGGVCAGQAHVVAEGQARPVVNWLLDVTDRVS